MFIGSIERVSEEIINLYLVLACHLLNYFKYFKTLLKRGMKSGFGFGG